MNPIIMRFRHIAVSLSCLCLAQLLNAQLTHTVTFDRNLLSIDTTVVESVSYLKIKYLDLRGEGSIGSPELPVHYLRFSVPYNAVDFTVTITEQNTVTEHYTLPVYPVQPVQPIDSADIPFVFPDSVVYNSSRYCPISPVQVVNEGFLDGDNHIVTIAVWPISYAPANGEMMFRNSVTIRLDYTLRNGNTTLASAPTPILWAITRQNSRRVHRWGREQTKRLVVNPSQVDGFAPITIAHATVPLNEATVLPSYEYTVVTSRALAPAFDRLLGWKRQKGLSAGVVCIEDILACQEFQQGDTLSHINDDAGKLRAYLEHAYKLGSLQYALLAGDYRILPIRYGYRKDYDIMSQPDNIDKMIPTDLYFSDFNGDWDSNRNRCYGEPNADQIDHYPEIFVGRLLCTTSQEVENYTEKLLRYERNPGNGDFSYLKKAFYCQSDQLQENNEAEIIKRAWGTTFIEHKIMQEEPSFDANETTGPTGKQVIDEMNNRYGFLSWHGHGAPSHIVVSNSAHVDSNRVITAFQNVSPEGFIQESGHGLDCLTNHDYPAIAYSIACTTTPFDIYGSYNIPYNIGSSFTVAGLYGGPAFLGNTREGYYKNYASATLEEEFVNLIKAGNCIGAAEALSKAYLNENKDSVNEVNTDLAHKVILAHHLIGCPEFSMWTDIPSVYSDISVTRTDHSITVSGAGITGSKIAITSGVNQLPEVKEATSTNITFANASPSSIVTVYKSNAIPYVAPLYLQNDTLDASQYFQVNDIHIGKAVDTNRTEGNVVIESGVLTFESNGDVWIGDGLIIKGGATLIIKNTGKAILSGGLVEGGGTLQIEAGEEIEIQPGFEAKAGANVEFK